MAHQVEETQAAVAETLPGLTADQLQQDFPEPVGRQILRTEDFLIHLAIHLAYHLGQIDYHRRIVTGEAGQVGAVPVKELQTARPA